MSIWPWDLVMIERDTITDGVEQNVERTPFDDGAVEQKRTAVRDWRVYNFDIMVYEENVIAFQAWLTEWAHRFFAFRDLRGYPTDDEDADPPPEVQVRVRGGNGSVTLEVQEGRLDGKRFRRASVELEGFA